eukprot:11244725-Heterocapsa_arctica.AAC.1
MDYGHGDNMPTTQYSIVPNEVYMDLEHEELIQAPAQQHMNNMNEQLAVQQAQLDSLSFDVERDRVSTQAAIASVALGVAGGVETTSSAALAIVAINNSMALADAIHSLRKELLYSNARISVLEHQLSLQPL